MKKTPLETPLRGPRPALTLALVLLAAGVMLAGGAWLARRTVPRRIPADRALLRESAATLQEELARLEQLYTGHLQRFVRMMQAAVPVDRVREAAAGVWGIVQYSVLLKRGTHPAHVKVATSGSAPPELDLSPSSKKLGASFTFPVPPDVFGGENQAAADAMASGWLGKPGEAWLGWWHQLDPQYTVLFLIRNAEVRAAVDAHLRRFAPAAWAPVRAAGGLDRLEGPNGRRLAGLADTPGQPPDFIVPLTSRWGAWQIVSWDRWDSRVEYDYGTLAIAGTLSAGLAVLGWVVAAAQRRALREVTARVSFVNRVSHELGAPLTNLGLYLELARDALAEEDAAESRRRLGVAMEETGRLSRLVGNVLTFARGERGSLALHPAPCRPAAVVAGVVEQFAPALARRGIQVESRLDMAAEVVLDADALAQITANLISNVEKYAAPGGWTGLVLTVADGTLRLTVEDRGPGIPRGETARVFLPFERLDSSLTEGVSGTGLGLAIARDLAGRMGGTVTLEHPATGGCLFTVEVKAGEVPRLLALPEPAPDPMTGLV